MLNDMKLLNYSNWLILGLVLAFNMVACNIDTYDAPEARLSGSVVYEGEPLGLRSNGVQLELWQDGYELNNKIPVYVAHDGTYSAQLFPGNYRLIALRDNGPWMNMTDSIHVDVNGNIEVNVAVTPFFITQNLSFTYNGQSGMLSADFQLHKPGDRPLESIGLYLGSTQLVDQNNQVLALSRTASDDEVGSPLQLAIQIDPEEISGADDATIRQLRDIFNKGYAFVRIGVRAQGSPEMIFSQVQKIEL